MQSWIETLPRQVRVVEVGPRDGLQNESRILPTAVKAAFVGLLAAAGLPEIEVTSFVHPRRVPQLADAEDLIALLPPAGESLPPAPVYSALLPNERGLDRALRTGIRKIAVFTAASETFAARNIGTDIQSSLNVYRRVIRRATEEGLAVRGYVSTCWICPYEGPVAGEQVAEAAAALLDAGADEVSLGETVGGAVPTEVSERLDWLSGRLPREKLALHFHDTSGTALANVLAALQLGFTVFDSSAGGLGGCPFAPGASGNLATEDLVYMLDRMGIHTGVALASVAAASAFLEPHLGRDLPGRQYRRLKTRTE